MACLDSIGVIESVGMAAALECADAAVKAANVKLLGYELSKGGGMVTIKISGNVSAVQAAVAAGTAAGAKVGKIVSKIVISRPHQDLDKVIFNREHVYADPPAEDKSGNEPEELPAEPVYASTCASVSEIIEVDALFEDDYHQYDETEPVKDEEEAEPKKTICNICSDPECPRQKGEPHANCIHFKDEKR